MKNSSVTKNKYDVTNPVIEYVDYFSIETSVRIRIHFPNSTAKDLIYLLDYYRIASIQQHIKIFKLPVIKNMSPVLVSKEVHMRPEKISKLNKILEQLDLITISYTKQPHHGGAPVTTIRLK